MRVNKLRKALAGDKPIFGMGFYSQSLAIMEIIGHSGFDYVFIDCEHAPLSVDSTLENVIRAADYAGLGTVVRVRATAKPLTAKALGSVPARWAFPTSAMASTQGKPGRAGKFPH